jgi:hypothetical protein
VAPAFAGATSVPEDQHLTLSETARGRQPLRSHQRPIIVVGVLVAAVLLAGLGYWLFAGPAQPGGLGGSTIVEMSGDGNKVSKHFYARSGWSIVWENRGKYFSYTIHGDTEFGQVITQNGPGNGITSPVPMGNFFIEVVAQGPWSIQVVQGG